MRFIGKKVLTAGFDRFLILSKSTVIKNAIALYIIQIAEFVVPLITVPFVVRQLGPAGFGTSSFILGFVGYFGVLVDYGFSLSATREISLNRDDPKIINKIFTTTIISKVALFALGFFLIIPIILFVPLLYNNLTLILISYLSLLGNILFPVWLYQGKEEMNFLAVSNSLTKFFLLISIFLFLHGTLSYIIIITVAQIINGILAFFRAFSQFKVQLIRVSFNDVLNALRSGQSLFLSSASLSLFTVGNSFVLGLFAPPTAVGYYSAAEKVIRASYGPIFPLIQSIYPKLVGLAKKSDKLYAHYLKKTSLVLLLISGSITLTLFSLSPFLARYLLGQEFSQSIILIKAMSPLPIIVAFASLLSTGIIFPLKKDVQYTYIVLFAGAINIILSALLSPRLNSLGAAISYSCSEIIVLILEIFVLRKFILNLVVAKHNE